MRPSDGSLARRASVLADRLFGLDYRESGFGDLMRGMELASRMCGMATLEACVETIEGGGSPAELLDRLAETLTIGETYFFRHAEQFSVLETDILPELIARRRACRARGGRPRLDIWSAACSSGEEAVSLAILLRKLLPDHRNWDLRILATDVNPAALAKARRAEYGAWSFRGVPGEIRERYFRQVPDSKSTPILDELPGIEYRRFNLADARWRLPAPPPGGFDLILCRNVLIYFTPGAMARAAGELDRHLAAGGWLMVGPSETFHMTGFGFEPRVFGKTTVFRSRGRDAGGCGDEIFLAAQLPGRTPVSPGDGEAGTEDGASAEDGGSTDGGGAAAGSGTSSAAGNMATKDAAAGGGCAGAEAVAGESPVAGGEPAGAEDFALARTLADRGDHAAAREVCGRAVAACRSDPDRRHLLAMILLESGDVPGALAAFRATVFLDPGHVAAHFMIGSLLRREGNERDGDRSIEYAVELALALDGEAILPGIGGMTASRFIEHARATLRGEEG